MSEGIQELSFPDVSIEYKIQQLIDSVVDQQRNEVNQLLSHWEEIKATGRQLELSSIEIQYKVFNSHTYTLSIASDSPKDLAMWKACVSFATACLNIEQYVESSKMSLSFSFVNEADVDNVMDYIDGLVRRTNFETQDIHTHFEIGKNISDTTLDQLIDSVAKWSNDRTNEIVGHWKWLFFNRPIHFHDFSISRAINGIVISVQCFNLMDLALWKACVANAFYKIDIQSENFESNPNEFSFNITIKNDEVNSVLEYLKPLSHGMFIETLCVGAVYEIIPHCINFFESNFVDSLDLSQRYQNNANIKIWLDFVAKVNPACVLFNRPVFANEIRDFLIPVSELVEEIVIRDMTYGLPVSVSAIREMLRRKCSNLTICGTDSAISFEEAEKIVRLAHHLKNPIYLNMSCKNMEPMNVQIGEYRVITSPMRSIYIQHINYN